MRWIWSPPVVVVWAVAVAWTVGVFALHFTQLLTGTYELYAFLRKPFLDAVYFFFILSFIGFIHEFGHAYAVKIYGGEVHDIGLALLYFTPAFYCDTTDALLFENKWQRLWVNTAGIYVEGFVCAAATALWVASYPDTLIHELAYKTMLFTGISTIFFNINPLIKIDGYHALTSVLEMPDLREDAFRHIGAVFQKSSCACRSTVNPTSPPAAPHLLDLRNARPGLHRRDHGRHHADLLQPVQQDPARLRGHSHHPHGPQDLQEACAARHEDREALLSGQEGVADVTKSPPALAAAAVVVILVLFVPWSRRVISAKGCSVRRAPRGSRPPRTDGSRRSS